MNSRNRLELSMSFTVFLCVRIIGEITVTLVIRTRDISLDTMDFYLWQILMFNYFSSLIDTISKLGLQISSVLLHMTIVIDKILEKGTVEYLIVHTTILEYFTIADKTSASDAICQLIPLLTQGALIIDGDEPTNAPELPKKAKAKKKRSKEPLIVRIMQTREGLKLGISCLKYGSAKISFGRYMIGQA
uniref:Leukotriene A-4 hydrolase-like protein n=1 Tax=Zea mays TaxID=4577 RepID=A0A804MQD7_MAIZE